MLASAARAEDLPAPSLPLEIVTIRNIGDDIRSPIADKMREIVDSFGPEERRPGIVEFKDRTNTPVLSAQLVQDIAADRSSLVERMSIRDTLGQPLIEETITANGK